MVSKRALAKTINSDYSFDFELSNRNIEKILGALFEELITLTDKDILKLIRR